jgi:predicted acyltransferase
MPEQPSGRLQSLDLFRGATIAAMVLVNNSGSSATYAQLQHSSWDGWTFTDTVFPFFLWIVGVAITLSTARRVERGEDRGRLLAHAFRRALIIFLLGFLLWPFPDFNWATIRIPGVLQRIAVCYLAATLIFLYSRLRGQILWIVGLNLAYIGLMFFYPVPGCGAGSLTKDCNFERYLDGIVLGPHIYAHSRYWDPEGLASTLPAISTTLLGVLAGHLLRLRSDSAARLKWLYGGGAVLIAAGQVLDLWMPFNKNLWSTSYVLLMAGLSSFCLGVWYWLADVKGWGRWFLPFQILGMNAIAAYVLSGIIERILQETHLAGGETVQTWLYRNVFLAFATPYNASILYGLANVAAVFFLAWLMWRRRWFLKL